MVFVTLQDISLIKHVGENPISTTQNNKNIKFSLKEKTTGGCGNGK